MGSIKEFVDSLTAGEVALLAALIGAVPATIAVIASVLTTRYLLKRGPNYTEHISQIDDTLAMLVQTQEDLKEQQAQFAEEERQRLAAQEKKQEQARWKPSAMIENSLDGNVYINKLVVKSTESFRLIEVSLLSPDGAKLEDYPRKDSWVDSKGFSFPIPSSSLNQLTDISPTWMMQETFKGRIRYVAQRVNGDVSYEGEIPFHGQRAYVQNMCSFKING